PPLGSSSEQLMPISSRTVAYALSASRLAAAVGRKRPRLAQETLAQRLRVEDAASCQVDNPGGDNRALAVVSFRNLQGGAHLFEGARHDAKGLGVERGMFFDVAPDGH